MNKISRVLVQPVKNLVMKIHVELLKEKEGKVTNFHNVFTFGSKTYLRVDLQSFVTIEMTDGEWSKDKSVLIDQRNMYQVIKGFEKSLENIYNGDVFAVNKEGKTVIHKDSIEKNTVKIYNMGNSNRLILRPSIIYDNDDMTYEGVVLYINKTENYVELPIDAFEALYFTLKKVDLFVYSQALLNYYLGTLRAMQVENKIIDKPSTPRSRKNIFNDEFVKSNLNDNNVLSDYNKEKQSESKYETLDGE